jgi:hypothetical protein
MLIVVNPGYNNGSGHTSSFNWMSDLTSVLIPLSDDYAMSVEGENSRRSVTIRK